MRLWDLGLCLVLFCFVFVSLCHLVFPWEYTEICANLTLISESGPGASRAFGKILHFLGYLTQCSRENVGSSEKSVAQAVSGKAVEYRGKRSGYLPTSGSASGRGPRGHSL